MSNVIFSWLHMSDIHFQLAVDTFNDAQIRNTLPDYLKSLNLQCDTVIFSGDFRYAPKKELTSADDACKYIKSLTKLVGVGDNQVVLIPGNHDLDRSKPREYAINGVRKEYKVNTGLIDAGVITDLEKNFDFYSNIQNHFSKSLNVLNSNPHDIVDLGACRLLLLNTAIVAGKDDDEHQIIVGSKYLSDLLEKAAGQKPVIAIGHHGFKMFRDDEEKEVTRYLDDKGVRLYLCGHEHDNRTSQFGNQGKQVNVGCMKQGEDNIVAGFSMGRLYDTGDIEIIMHKWDRDNKAWIEDKPNNQIYTQLYPESKPDGVEDGRDEVVVKKVDYPFSIKGYQLIGGLGCEGIKYIWEKGGDNIVESIAFNERVRIKPNEDDRITSAYTISTSIGCPLAASSLQCVFCQTGANKYHILTADDIALQCIFMAEYDSDCPSYPNVRSNKREFAFMGQGEPGLCYPQIKQAILLNDYVMKKIGQTVSRYIISTCGVTDFMSAFIEDCKNKVFSNRVSLHFSLNAIGDERNTIMPINQSYDYKTFLDKCYRLYEVTNEKIGVGILLMVNYKTTDGMYISLDANKLKTMLGLLKPDVFKIDLCTVNRTTLGSQHQLSNEDANKYLEIATSMGFESKIFASFGDSADAGCGMLNSSTANIESPGRKTINHFNRAVELLEEAKRNVAN